MSRPSLVIAACAASALAAFGVGRWSAPSSPTVRSAASAAQSAACTLEPTPSAAAAPQGAAPPGRASAASPGLTRQAGEVRAEERRAELAVPTSPADRECPAQLQTLTERVARDERQRRETDGQPIKEPPPNLPERFSQAALTAAMTHALQQNKIPGRVETIDCVEYPCILYGRIFGDEDNLERIERARAFAPYRADLMTMLSWTLTDQSFARSAHAEERPERMLFAIALYTREDRARLGDNLDRRIRARTADLWNTLRPDDEE